MSAQPRNEADLIVSSSILDEIVAHKRTEIEAAQAALPSNELEARIQDAPEARSFVESLRLGRPLGLIAEVKKASPSAGLIRENFDPVSIAAEYEAHGARCISVLTDEKYFQGSLDYLVAVRQQASIPVMRKEFILDRYQILEARAAGADCVLLIAECLDHCQLRDLYFFASELGMESLIEIYDRENLDRVLDLDPSMLGINNRDLRTFVTELSHTTDLLDQIPDEILVISESGIRTNADVVHLAEQGVGGILVGESLMRQPEIGPAVEELLGHSDS